MGLVGPKDHSTLDELWGIGMLQAATWMDEILAADPTDVEIILIYQCKKNRYTIHSVQPRTLGINISNRTDGSKIRHARLSERKMNADEGIFEPKRKHKSARLSGAVWAIKCLLLGKQS